MVTVVLGGGLAGLSAAWKLSENGSDVVVIEKESGVGGLARTCSFGDLRYDFGPHRFHTKDNGLLRTIEKLCRGDLILRERKSQICLKGKLIDYPLRARNAFFSLGFSTSVRILWDYFSIRLRNMFFPIPDSSFESWTIKRFGKALYDIYFGPYTAKIWGITPVSISKDWAAQRISLMSLGDAIRRALFRSKEVPRTYVSTFYYPTRGIGEIPERIADEIVRKGGKIILNSKVIEVKVNSRRVEAVMYEGKEGRKSVQCDHVISSIPLIELTSVLQPKPPLDILEASRRLQYRAIVFVYVVLRMEHVTQNQWIYFPEADVMFNRVSEPKNFSSEMTPENETILCVETTCDKGDEIWNSDDGDLCKRVVDGLQKKIVEMPKADQWFVRRVEYAYPLYAKGYETDLKEMRSYLSSIENLMLIGRNGLFRYSNMDHSMLMGILAAKSILEGARYDVERVASEEGYFG